MLVKLSVPLTTHYRSLALDLVSEAVDVSLKSFQSALESLKSPLLGSASSSGRGYGSRFARDRVSAGSLGSAADRSAGSSGRFAAGALVRFAGRSDRAASSSGRSRGDGSSESGIFNIGEGSRVLLELALKALIFGSIVLQLHVE